MARKTELEDNGNQRELDDLSKLKAIFDSNPHERFDLENKGRADELNLISDFIADQFLSTLGTSNDYEIMFDEPEPIGGNLYSKTISVKPKPESTAVFVRYTSGVMHHQIEHIVSNTYRTFFEFDLSVSDAMAVLSAVSKRIETECGITYRFVDDKLTRIGESDDVYKGGVISGPNTKFPHEAKQALHQLKIICGINYIRSKVRMEIEPLTYGDKVIEIKRRVGNAWRYKDYYEAALKLVSDDIAAEIELQKERKLINDAVTSDGTGVAGHGKSPASKIKRHPELTIDRAILLINAIGGTRLKSADKEKLAEVIAFLTGDLPESIRQRCSALNPENSKYKGNTESGMKKLREDLEILSRYFDLIGLRGELEKLSDNLGIPLTK